jgi:hypothetical protein
VPTNKVIAPITIPVYCYRSKKELDSPPSIKTQVIHLGMVQVNESPEVWVYGDPDLIGIIKEVGTSKNSIKLFVSPYFSIAKICKTEFLEVP